MSVATISQENVLQIANSFPATRHILIHVGSLLQNPTVSIDDIVAPLKRDPTLAARLIRSANSAAYGRAEPVASVEDALKVIGCKEVHRLVGFALLDQFGDEGLLTYGISHGSLRENSLFCAILMEELGSGAGENPQFCYTVGLLRSIGKVALNKLADYLQPGDVLEKIEDTGIIEWERSVFGITNNEAGAMILKEWRFPAGMGTAVKGHYVPDADASPIAHLLHVAACMAQRLGHGMPGEAQYWNDSDEVYKRAGLDPKRASAIIDHALNSFDRILRSAP
jgi:HD-like signal output (HDOD) protein